MNSTIEGELRSLSEKGFEGWAWDTAKPHDFVEVEIVCGDVILATARANVFSLELVQRKKGNGMHGFSALPDALPKLEYPLLVKARVKGSTEYLSGEVSIAGVAAFVGIVPDSEIHDYEGYVDGIQKGKIAGWVTNRSLPGRPVSVELLDGTRVLMTVVADRMRKDVEEQRPGAGHSGFELPIPVEMLDEHMHSLHVRVAGSNFELGNSPVTLGAGTATALVKEVLRMREEVAEMQGRMNALTDQVNDFVEMENTISSLAEEIMSLRNDLSPAKQDGIVRQLLERFEALYNIQRDSFEREIVVLRAAVLGLPRKADPFSEVPVVPVAGTVAEQAGTPDLAAAGSGAGSPIAAESAMKEPGVSELKADDESTAQAEPRATADTVVTEAVPSPATGSDEAVEEAEPSREATAETDSSQAKRTRRRRN